MLSHSPLNSREKALELSAFVDEPVSIFCCQIAAPLAYLDVALKEGRVDYGLREFISNRGLLISSSRHVVIWSVGKGAALTLWFACVVWNLGRWELELGLLFLGGVGRGQIGGKLVEEVLATLLLDCCW